MSWLLSACKNWGQYSSKLHWTAWIWIENFVSLKPFVRHTHTHILTNIQQNIGISITLTLLPSHNIYHNYSSKHKHLLIPCSSLMIAGGQISVSCWMSIRWLAEWLCGWFTGSLAGWMHSKLLGIVGHCHCMHHRTSPISLSSYAVSLLFCGIPYVMAI